MKRRRKSNHPYGEPGIPGELDGFLTAEITAVPEQMGALAELQQAVEALTQGMSREPALGLALAAAWLDPLMFDETELDDYDDSEDANTLTLIALEIARRCLPELYAQLVEGLRGGWSFETFGDEFCDGMSRRWPHIRFSDHLYGLIYGVPLEFVGLGRYEPGDFEEKSPELAGFMVAYFGASAAWPTSETDEDSETDPANAEEVLDANDPVAKLLRISLNDQDRQPYADLFLMLAYLFSATGNDLADATSEEFYESGSEHPEWEPGNLDVVDDAFLQVDIINGATKRALALLETDEEIAGALIRNIAIARAAVAQGRKEKGIRMDDGVVRPRQYGYGDIDVHILDIKLDWPKRPRTRCAAKSYERAAGADAALLFVRHCYA